MTTTPRFIRLQSGSRFTIYSYENGQDCDFTKQFEELDKEGDRAKLGRLLRAKADDLLRFNREKETSIGEGLFGLKSYQIRLPYCFFPGKAIVISHLFVKKRNDWPKEEIQKARKRLSEAGTLLSLKGSYE